MGKLYTDSSGPILDMQLEFPHMFEVEILRELPMQADELRYFPAARRHDCDGILLRVVPNGMIAWSGLFAGEASGNYKSGVYSCPDGNTLCIVSNGAAYLLDVRDPDGYQEISLTPVLDVVPAKEAGVLVLANYTDVLAWDASGRRWLAERVSYDGIRALRAEGSVLRGLAWSPVDGERPFAIDLATGAHR